MDDLYCGIKLNWHCGTNKKHRWVDLSMLGYIQCLMVRYKHIPPTKPQHQPNPSQPKKYRAAAQIPMSEDETPKVDATRKLHIQQIIGAMSYYTCAIDMPVLIGLSTTSTEQTTATTNTAKKIDQMMNYLATHHDATIRYWALDMV